MVFHVLHLSQGRTTLSNTIKSNTIKHCLKAESYAPLNNKQLGPLLDDINLETNCIKNVLSKGERWELILNRREPVTIKMKLHLLKK